MIGVPACRARLRNGLIVIGAICLGATGTRLRLPQETDNRNDGTSVCARVPVDVWRVWNEC